MGQLLSLEKILHVKENEKQTAELKHHQSIEVFEKVALNLYELLKKKESAEAFLEETMKQKMTVTELQQQTIHIEQLKENIIHLQEEVAEARTEMESRKNDLTDKHIEFKKIEKIIEQRHEKIRVAEQKEENSLMDELAIQQYMKLKNR